MTDRRVLDLEQRAKLVRNIIDELDGIRARCLRLGLAMAPPIHSITSQLMSEWHWCKTEASRQRAQNG